MSDEARERWQWKAMPYGAYSACVGCDEMTYCHGKSRDRMVCLDCFTEDETLAKLRRSGTTGPRRKYIHRRRRPKTMMVEVVRKMRDEGMVVAAIADEIGISEKTVRNCLSLSRTSENGPATPVSIGESVPRKEELDPAYVLLSGDA